MFQPRKIDFRRSGSWFLFLIGCFATRNSLASVSIPCRHRRRELAAATVIEQRCEGYCCGCSVLALPVARASLLSTFLLARGRLDPSRLSLSCLFVHPANAVDTRHEVLVLASRAQERHNHLAPCLEVSYVQSVIVVSPLPFCQTGVSCRSKGYRWSLCFATVSRRSASNGSHQAEKQESRQPSFLYCSLRARYNHLPCPVSAGPPCISFFQPVPTF